MFVKAFCPVKVTLDSRIHVGKEADAFVVLLEHGYFDRSYFYYLHKDIEIVLESRNTCAPTVPSSAM